MAKDHISLRKRFAWYIHEHWIQNNHALQDISCVYAILAYDIYNKSVDIAYVGSTIKLFSRYKSHKVPEMVQSMGLINILFYVPMDNGFYDYEIKLIRRLKPIFNKNTYSIKTKSVA